MDKIKVKFNISDWSTHPDHRESSRALSIQPDLFVGCKMTTDNIGNRGGLVSSSE